MLTCAEAKALVAVMFYALCLHLNCSFLPSGVELLSRGCIHLKCGDALSQDISGDGDTAEGSQINLS